MLTTRIAILGGGLSGLYAAYLLEQQGIKDYVLLEARHTLGGRIASASYLTQGESNQTGNSERFDLGPTWFWPAFQPEFDKLINALKLDKAEQYETGEMMMERANGPAFRAQGYLSSPASARLRGSMSSLIEKLSQYLSTTSIITDQQVLNLQCNEEYIELKCQDSAGQLTSYHAQQVLLAIPPRLAVTEMKFTPSLPDALVKQWHDTATWMAPHAKYIAIYDTHFWRERGLSGEGRSGRGPLAEIHDASIDHGSAALFGFFGIPAVSRKNLSHDDLCVHCRAQLVRLFGAQAAKPKAEFIKDWAKDPYTSTQEDLHGQSDHGRAPFSNVTSGIWQNRILGIGSEWSPQFPGYLAGAIEAVQLGLQDLAISTHNLTNE
jgi:monoamine oxidase